MRAMVQTREGGYCIYNIHVYISVLFEPVLKEERAEEEGRGGGREGAEQEARSVRPGNGSAGAAEGR